MKANHFFRHLAPSPLCPFCHNFPETNEHILFTCEWTLKVSFAHPISYRVPVNQISTADQWIELFFLLIPSWLQIGFIVNSIYTCDFFTLAYLEAPVSLYFHTFSTRFYHGSIEGFPSGIRVLDYSQAVQAHSKSNFHLDSSLASPRFWNFQNQYWCLLGCLYFKYRHCSYSLRLLGHFDRWFFGHLVRKLQLRPLKLSQSWQASILQPLDCCPPLLWKLILFSLSQHYPTPLQQLTGHGWFPSVISN